MSGSSDDLPIDSIPLDELERLRQEFRLDDLQNRLLKAIDAGLPVRSIGNLISEDFWLACLIQDIQKGTPNQRSRALQMLGMYLGILSDKTKKKGRAKITFQEFEDGK